MDDMNGDIKLGDDNLETNNDDGVPMAPDMDDSLDINTIDEPVSITIVSTVFSINTAPILVNPLSQNIYSYHLSISYQSNSFADHTIFLF